MVDEQPVFLRVGKGGRDMDMYFLAHLTNIDGERREQGLKEHCFQVEIGRAHV